MQEERWWGMSKMILIDEGTVKLALEALMRSRKAVSGDLDLAGCAYGKNDPDGHRYDDAKQALVTLDKAITALREALVEQPAQQDIPDLIAGALGVSRGTAYDLMREALAQERSSDEQPAQQEPLTGGDERRHIICLCPDCIKTPQRKPLSNGEIYTAYITATNQTLRPQDERLAFAFARAIEAAHGIKGDA